MEQHSQPKTPSSVKPSPFLAAGKQVLFDRETFSAGLLRLFLYYRFFLALLLLGLNSTQVTASLFGQKAPDLYMSGVIIYVVLSAISLGFYQLQKHHLGENQRLFTLLIDIGIQALLLYCSGGLSSGLGYLMIITVATGSIFFTGQLAILIPAFASICIIAESLLSSYFSESYSNILPAGVLGLLLFLTSLLFSRLSKALAVAQNIAVSKSELSAELQELNHLILNRIHTGIMVVNEQGIIQQLNSASRELLGLNNGANPLAIGHSIRTESRLLKRLLRWKKRPAQKTSPFTPQQGSTEVLASFATMEHGESPGTIIFLEDFRAAAQQAQQLKLASLGRLTGSIAHEIRNPLAAISHASELLAERKEEDKTNQRLTHIIESQVKRVNHIVENVLQLSRNPDHRLERLPTLTWLESFTHQYALGCKEPPMIDLQLPEPVPGPLTFDPIHLQQILTNLLDNALRFSANTVGYPWAAIAVNQVSTSALITIDVLDKGPGVSHQHRQKLFEPFFTTSTGGSGLGLYIARELCTINFAAIKYKPPEGEQLGYFRITLVHPHKMLNLDEDNHG